MAINGETMKTAPTKSDSDIRQAVLDELEWEPSIQSANLKVEVKHGVATLTGDVKSYFERWIAENVVRRVSGVKGLNNEVQVSLEDAHKKSDREIMTAVQHVLDWTTSLSTEDISARVKNGWVTLTGTVAWQFQKVAVLNAVRHLKGVLGLKDELTVSPVISKEAVRVDIEAALRRSAAQDAQDIEVSVNGSEVTLSGHVNSWPEHVAATSAAWNAPGVTNVVDKLTMVY